MKNLKLLGLAAVAAMALMAFVASSASATALYSGSTMLGPKSIIDFSIASGGKVKLSETGGEPIDECSSSTAKGELTNTGSSTETVKAKIVELTWGSCTFPTTTISRPEWEFHYEFFSTKATVTSTSGSEGSMTVNTIFFGSCIYGETGPYHAGTLTTFSSGHAILHINSFTRKLPGSNGICPETSIFTFTYTGTSPTNLRVEEQ